MKDAATGFAATLTTLAIIVLIIALFNWGKNVQEDIRRKDCRESGALFYEGQCHRKGDCNE